MLQTASKNIVSNSSYDFFKLRFVLLNTKCKFTWTARNFKFGLYLPYHLDVDPKSGGRIFKILLFGNFMCKKRQKKPTLPPILAAFAHKIYKKQNFQNLPTRFVELHIRKVQSKFQVLCMYAVQMNVPFVIAILIFRAMCNYRQIQNSDFQKIITRVRNSIFDLVFNIFLNSMRSFKIT